MTILSIIQIIVSVLLVACILLQSKGGGLSGVFGGRGEIYQTKRGLEKTIFISTIVLAVFFLALGVLRIFLAK